MSPVQNKAIKVTGSNLLYSGEVDAHDQLHGYEESFVTSKGQFEGVYNTRVCADGSPQLMGKYIDLNGHKYTGEFFKGLRDGLGLSKSPSGAQYSGQYKDHTKNHLVTEAFSDSALIEYWVDGIQQHGIAPYGHAKSFKAAPVENRPSGLIDDTCFHSY
jgi:hypothetical protein